MTITRGEFMSTDKKKTDINAKEEAEHDSKIADYEQTIAECTAALRIDPNDVGAYNNRGLAYAYMGDYDQAVADFEAALQIDPDYTEAKKNLRKIRRAQERQKGAGNIKLLPPSLCD
jgi:tetratricopeptide (TPR) repeat protein